MAVVYPGKSVQVRGLENSHIMVIGGDNIGPRRMFWNIPDTYAKCDTKPRVRKAITDIVIGRAF